MKVRESSFLNRGRRYRFKTRPYKHQVKALKFALRHYQGVALFMPMRSGKTKTAIDWVGMLHLKFGVKRVLIVCPLSVVGVWKKQLKIHLPEEYVGKIRFLIINYEKVYDREPYEVEGDRGWTPIPRQVLYRWRPHVVIVDEAHKIGNPSAAQSYHLWQLVEDVKPKAKMILTGTPFHRKILMVFGMYRFLNKEIFGTSFTVYKRRYGRWGGYGDLKLVGQKNRSEWREKISPITFLMKSLPLVAPQHEVVPYRLEESEAIYKSMADDFIAWVGDGVVEAPIALTRALRLSQICGGRLRDSEGTLRRVGREKRRAFSGLIGDEFVPNELQKFVVFARFVPELKDIVEVCRGAGYKVFLMYGKTSGDLREQRIAAFEESEGKAVFVSQVQTGALGIDLSSADVCVFYSLPESLVDYDQDCARIRTFKDKRTLTYYYLCGEGTIEEIHISALRANLNLIDSIERDPTILSYTTHG
jgi:SNF2 family DNA or RNA helicase